MEQPNQRKFAAIMVVLLLGIGMLAILGWLYWYVIASPQQPLVVTPPALPPLPAIQPTPAIAPPAIQPKAATSPSDAVHISLPPPPPMLPLPISPPVNDPRQYLMTLWSASLSAGGPPLRRDESGMTLNIPSDIETPFAPTLITMDMTGTPHAILEEICRQAKIRVGTVDTGALERVPESITIKAHKLPLMEVICRLCAQSGLRIVRTEPLATADDLATTRPYPPPQTDQISTWPRIVLAKQAPHHAMGPWSVSGPFSYEVQSIQHNEPGETPGAGGRVSINILAIAEPKLLALAGPGRLDLQEAVDENGNSLLDPAQMSAQVPGMDAQNGNQDARPITINFQCPPNYGRKLVRLRAVDSATILRFSRRLEISQLPAQGASVTQELGGMNVTIRTDQDSPQFKTLHITVDQGERDDIDWPQLRAALGRMVPQLSGTDGSTFSNTNIGSSIGSGGEFNGNYGWFTLDRRGHPVSVAGLSADLPVEVKTIHIPVEFDNLPLP